MTETRHGDDDATAAPAESPGALRFEQLFVRGFRNLEPLDLSPSPRFNVFSGDNGQGKSNLLEVLAYLSTLRSFRAAPADELVRRDGQDAVLAGKVEGPPAPHTLKVRLHRGRARELALDDKRPRTLAGWLAVCPVVVFHPGELALAQGGPETRRKLLDGILEEIDPSMGPVMLEYGKALRSRNRLLRSERPDLRAVAAFDPILARSGALLVAARRALVDELAPRAQATFEWLFGDSIPVDIRYAPRIEGGQDALLEALARSLDKDRARGFTAEGPHADDLALQVHERGARHHASQGQQRSLVLALKLAELEVLARRIGRVPPFLLDDVSSELDRTRAGRFFRRLSDLGGQVFLTTTMPELVLLEGEGRADFRVEEGRVSRVKTGSSRDM